ncbi:hypothetical protein Lal_00014332 [Lupinus albus]|nr:hypothetical protein Lal_00014332 [Lupinus albus]
MTRDNLYWLSHDQVALFKTFRGTASRCKQTINHVQADYQPRRPQDKTAQLSVIRYLTAL